MKVHLDTRVVLLTSPGRAAVASLLVEGPGATQVVTELFRPANSRPFHEQPPGRIVFGRWPSGDGPGEEVVVCRRSDERVEIHCHGGQAASAAIVTALTERGCPRMDWRDWIRQSTADAIEADALIALASAPTERTVQVLWDQHRGALRRAVDEISALATAGNTVKAARQIDALLAFSALGRHLVEPWKVVLVGPPNVGKSSLINALLGYERAIVHATPGTTRDVVTAAAAVDGWPIELADTAGLRDGGEPLEAAGMRLAHDRIRAAELVLLVRDGSQSPTREDESLAEQWPEALFVSNKSDLPSEPGADVHWGLRVSALTGSGLDELVRAIAQRLVPEAPRQGQGVPFVPWQVEALRAAREALESGNLALVGQGLSRFDVARTASDGTQGSKLRGSSPPAGKPLPCRPPPSGLSSLV